MKFLSFVLAVLAAVVFLIGGALKLTTNGLLWSIAPVTFWRFSIACLGFAIYLHLYARDRE